MNEHLPFPAAPGTIPTTGPFSSDPEANWRLGGLAAEADLLLSVQFLKSLARLTGLVSAFYLLLQILAVLLRSS